MSALEPTRHVIGIGAGGHAKVLIEAMVYDRACSLVGLLDAKRSLHGREILSVPVLGDDRLLPELVRRDEVDAFFVGVGSVGDMEPRQRLFCEARALGLEPISIIHANAVVSPSARLGPGIAVLANAVINAEAQIGENVIINTGAIVEHDCRVGDHVHVASGARLASTVAVGTGSLIGAGATVRQCLTIGSGAIVGAGAVVVRDVPDSVTVVGVPARIMPEKRGCSSWKL